jgi:hypothetical protein
LVKAFGRVAAAAALAILFGGDFFTPQLPASVDGGVLRRLASMPAAAGNELLRASAESRDDRDPADSSDAFTDLYGNEVSDAIATYTFDQSGSLYELHSPQTELPKLGSPKS